MSVINGVLKPLELYGDDEMSIIIGINNHAKPLLGRTWILHKLLENQQLIEKNQGAILITDFGIVVRVFRQPGEHGAIGHFLPFELISDSEVGSGDS